MTYRVIDERFIRGGMIREELAYLLAPGALSDASNLIFDRPGIARQRGGSTALVSGSQTAFATTLGFCNSQDGTVIEELYGADGKGGGLNVINKTTGAATSIGSVFQGTMGRPVNHFGFLGFPQTTPSTPFRGTTVVAGQTSSTGFVSTAAVNLVVGQQQVTLGGADTTTNIKVGAVVQALGTGFFYFGRVVSVDSSTKFTMWPTPNITFATIAAGLNIGSNVNNAGGACACSFQNRLLYGNTTDYSSTGAALIADRRVVYSVLPNETGILLGGATVMSGAVFVQPTASSLKNFFEIPGTDPIVAMEPVNNNELLILSSGGVVIFTGELSTQTTTFASGVTFDLSPLNTNAGCLSDLSVQRTPHGIIWASAEGIMLYAGGGRTPEDLTDGKIHTYWRDLTRGSSFAVHGSFYTRNHYVVSGSSGGSTFSLAYNMDNGAWSPLTGVGTDIFYGVSRPSDRSQAFILRWYDVSGAAPSMTNGQTLRGDSIFAPDVVGQTKTDADGAVVAFTGKTRVITDDANTERMLRRVAVRYALEAAGANATVAVGSRLDTQDTAGTPTVSVGSLSNTAVLTITGQSNATPIVITTSTNHGLQDEDSVDIRGVTTNSNANGRWKIKVLSNTTFSLNQSSGNGATTSTGTCKKISEQELLGGSVDIGQGNYLSIASSGTVNRFELHGFRLGAMELNRGMG